MSIFLASRLKSSAFTKLLVDSSVLILCAWSFFTCQWPEGVDRCSVCVCVCVCVCVAEKVLLPSVWLNKDNTDTG